MAAPTPQSYTTWGSDVIDAIAREIERQRQELQPGPASEPDTEDVLTLAAIIREVNGNNRLGAAALAEAILAHPGSRWHPAAPPDRDDFIDAAWGDMTPAEAVEGLEGLADDQWVPPTKEERVLARELLRLKAQGVDISNRLPSDPAQKMRWLAILDKMQKCLNSAAQLEHGLREYHASFPDSPHPTDS